MRRMGLRTAVLCVLGGSVLGVAQARAQTPPVPDGAAQGDTSKPGPAENERRGGAFAGMGRVMGEVTAVAGNTVTVKAAEGGTVQVVTTENTRLMKDRGTVKVSDLHVGDGLMAIGNLDAPNKTLHAAVVMAEDAAQVKAMRENLGKTYITGRVTAVDLDNATMTVERSDHISQTIGFDETTSFKRAVRGGNGGSGGPGGSGSGGTGRGSGGFGGGAMGMGALSAGDGLERAFNSGESITLAEIKVGDTVAGTGGLKKGVFVPTRVVDSPPRQRREPREGANGPTSGPSSSTPTPGPQPR